MKKLPVQTCPVCASLDASAYASPPLAERWVVGCPRCGDFTIDQDAALFLLKGLPTEPDKRARPAAVVSHQVWRMRGGGDGPHLTMDLVKGQIAADDLPTPMDQLDNLVIILGDEANGSSSKLFQSRSSEWPRLASRIGALSANDLSVIFEAGSEAKLITAIAEPGAPMGSLRGRLTMAGWSRYQVLTRQKVDSSRAFMAMQYNDPVLDRLVNDHFRPAVEATGFTLWRLDQGLKAGPIDNRMRVEIRRARFLIADLTHANPNAYWEAGFAEGLGRPVIYTCHQNVLNGKRAKAKIHFNTRNCQIVPWGEKAKEIDRAVAMLKATIRNTLPAEAVLGD